MRIQIKFLFKNYAPILYNMYVILLTYVMSNWIDFLRLLHWELYTDAILYYNLSNTQLNIAGYENTNP